MSIRLAGKQSVGSRISVSVSALIRSSLGIVALACLASAQTDEESGRLAQTGLSALPQLGGPSEHGDPIKLGELTATYSVTDLTVQNSLGPFSLIRHYDSSPWTWLHRNDLQSVPKPFGSTPGDSRSLHWWHNLYSFVQIKPPQRRVPPEPEPDTWVVRDMSGTLIEFDSDWCQDTAQRPCFGVPISESTSQTKLYWDNNKLRFVLYKPDGRYYYESKTAFGGNNFYFLTRVEDPRYPETANPLTRFTITFASPVGCGGTNQSGPPFVSEVTTADGTKVKFHYRTLPNGCVLSSVGLIERPVSGIPPVEKAVVVFAYSQVNGVETPGLLHSVTRPEVNVTTVYGYGTPAAPAWSVHVNGRLVTSKALDPRRGSVLTDTTPDRTLTVSSDVSFGAFDPQNCPDGPTNGCRGAKWQSFTNPTATVGNGSPGVTELTTSFLVERNDSAAGSITRVATESCATGDCSGFSPGETKWDWHIPGPNSSTPAPLAVQDRRGNWTAYRHREAPAPPEGTWREDLGFLEPIETSSAHVGAIDKTGTGTLRTQTYTYEYGGQGQTPQVYEQLLKSTSDISVLGPFGTSATTANVYDLNTNRLKATIRSGFTSLIDNGQWTTAERHIGIFYFTNYQCSNPLSQSDPLQRTLEIHGPCLVSGPNATGCNAGGNIPITQNFYWPANTGNNNANRLQKASVYTNNAGSSCVNATHLDTTYDQYDARGHVLSQTDPNGVVTTSVYEEDRLRQTTTVGSRTEYYYDDEVDNVFYIRYPAGNYEVFCYRENTPGRACSGGTITNKLQWKARTPSPAAGVTPDGSTWVEKVVYTYQNGLLATETYLDAAGQVRRARKHSADPQGRPTFEQWGDAPGKYSSASVFDAEGNVAGIGMPYNEAPAFCGGLRSDGSPNSARCDTFLYDRANRLSGVYQNVTPAGPTLTTCVSYDQQSNLTSVSSDCIGNGIATTYLHDDFGNLVLIWAPWTDDGNGGIGTTRYEYDAQGHRIGVQTPAMALKQERLVYTYDRVGRPLSLQRVAEKQQPAVETIHSFSYDGTITSPPAGCPNPNGSTVGGRLQMRQDSFGKTWYQYNSLGQVTARFRQRQGQSGCGVTSSESSPNSLYAYSPDGRLINETYPHGRVVRYAYHANGSGNEDRIASISVDTWDGAASSTRQIVSNTAWEPYGGLRAYQITAPLAAGGAADASVEYLSGDNASAGAPQNCATARPSGGDHTGRLRALWVSRGPLGGVPAGVGDIYKRTYTWKADQLLFQDTCILDNRASVIPNREQFADPGMGNGYDQLLRLTNMSRPSGEFALRGGVFDRREYTYSDRGNRLTDLADSWKLQSSYFPDPFVDRLASRSAIATSRGIPASWFTNSFSYDADGRVRQKLWANDSTGQASHRLTFDSTIDASHGAVGAVYRSVQVNGANYEYFYDADGRRWKKQYPSGNSDEFFFENIRLLEDRGQATATTPAPYPLDEYIWLDGRPVAFIKSKFDSNWQRQADLTGDCSRNGEAAPCGIYFLVADYLGKPVLVLDSYRRVAGAADYEPFGHVNRVTHLADTEHPYRSNTRSVLATFRQPPAVGTTVRLRARFALVDTKSSLTFPPRLGDYAYLTDRSGADLGGGRIEGEHRGAAVSSWITVPPDGQVEVRFASGNSRFQQLTGIVLEGYEYQRHETGASPVWTPLRFAGQYFDSETDLCESMNRYYDPTVGRFLQPDRALSSPRRLLRDLQEARTPTTYAYAANNPLHYVDPTGDSPIDRIVAIRKEIRSKASAILSELGLTVGVQSGPLNVETNQQETTMEVGAGPVAVGVTGKGAVYGELEVATPSLGLVKVGANANAKFDALGGSDPASLGEASVSVNTFIQNVGSVYLKKEVEVVNFKMDVYAAGSTPDALSDNFRRLEASTEGGIKVENLKQRMQGSRQR